MSAFDFPLLDDYSLDDREQSLAEFLMRLQFIKPKVELEFEDAFASWREVQSVRAAIHAELSAMHRDVAVRGVGIYTPGLARAELREQSALLRGESAAGSLILMLDDVMQRLRRSVWDDAAKGPKAQDFALGALTKTGGHATTLVYATGNAYRHSRDWLGLIKDDDSVNDTHEQFGKAKSSLAILEPVIGLSAISMSMTCIAAVTAMSLDASGHIFFDALWNDTISNVARDFAKLYCNNKEAHERVVEALDYQEAVTSMEVSYTMDEGLFHDSE